MIRSQKGSEITARGGGNPNQKEMQEGYEEVRGPKETGTRRTSPRGAVPYRTTSRYAFQVQLFVNLLFMPPVFVWTLASMMLA